MKRLVFTTLLGFLLSYSFCQSRTILGKIVDAQTQAPVRYANIVVLGTTKGGFTNHGGYFQLEVEKDESTLIISHINYQTGRLDLTESNSIVSSLEPSVTILDGIELSDYMANSIHSWAKPEPLGLDSLGSFKIIERNTSYWKGWENFRSSVAHGILGHPEFKPNEFSTSLRFGVNETGQALNVEFVTDSAVNKKAIEGALLNLNQWIPPVQRSEPVVQQFSLKIELKGEPSEFVEVPASYPGGVPAFYEYLKQEIKYPRQAQRMGIEGKVTVEFIVEKDSTLTNLKVISGIGAGCDEEAVRVLAKSGKWIPGTQNGKPVRQKMLHSILFMFSNSYGKPSQIQVLGRTNPRFPGGSKALYNYLDDRSKEITAEIPPNNIDNTVVLLFSVAKNGAVRDVEIIQGLSEQIDQEAVKIFESMPYWIPGTEENSSIDVNGLTGRVKFGNIKESDVQAALKIYNKGVTFFSDGKYEKALEQFSKAIEKNPTNLNFYYNRAATLLELDRTDEACADLERIKDRDKSAASVFEQYCGNGSED